mgnify:CR=1 FL=1
MIRKQIYLEEEMAKKVEKMAEFKNTSQAEIIRNALKKYMMNSDIPEETDPLLKLIGIADVDIEDGSINHDNIYMEDINNE